MPTVIHNPKKFIMKLTVRGRGDNYKATHFDKNSHQFFVADFYFSKKNLLLLLCDNDTVLYT